MHLMTAGELRFWHMERNYVSCRKCHVQHQAQERLRNKVWGVCEGQPVACLLLYTYCYSNHQQQQPPLCK